MKITVDFIEIDHMLHDRPLVVGSHGKGLPPDNRHPFGIGEAREIADRLNIVETCAAQRPDRGLFSFQRRAVPNAVIALAAAATASACE